MRKVTMLEHVSLDGFMAGPNGEMDWIHVDEEMFDAGLRLTDAADTAIFGRATYQMMQSYWPTAADRPGASRHDVAHGRWINAATKLVFSRTLQASDWQNTTFVSGDVAATIEGMKQQPGKNLVLIGSAGLARQFIALGLVDEFWINVNPVVLGGGVPLFPGEGKRSDLTLLESVPFASGVIGLHYEKASSAGTTPERAP
jgi:dihydrofolate reductase